MTPRGILLLALVAIPFGACGGVNDPEAAGPGPAAPSPSPAVATTAMSREQEVAPGVVVRVDVSSTGGDERRTWLNVQVAHDNRTPAAVPLDGPTLHCAGSAGEGRPRGPRLVATGSGGRTVGVEMPPDADGVPLRACRAPAYVAVGGSRWALGPDDLEYLNAELARDPGRPYRWVATDDRFSAGYQVVVVPGITADQAISVLKPRRGAPDPDDFDRVVVADHGDGVVLFGWGLVPDEQVAALSRIEGLAATVGNTGGADDRILVARRGKVVRYFDPLVDENYAGTPPLPQEKGLDLVDDTGPAAWTLIERLTEVHITRDWLLDHRHPGFRLRDWQ